MSSADAGLPLVRQHRHQGLPRYSFHRLLLQVTTALQLEQQPTATLTVQLRAARGPWPSDNRLLTNETVPFVRLVMVTSRRPTHLRESIVDENRPSYAESQLLHSLLVQVDGVVS